MKISYNKVTWYSQVAAIVIFVGVYFLGFYVGRQYEMANGSTLINNVIFLCHTPAGATIAAQFYGAPSKNGYVNLELSDGRTFSLPQSISADGGRYTDPSESFVFWNKGNGAFIQEHGVTTYTECATK